MSKKQTEILYYSYFNGDRHRDPFLDIVSEEYLKKKAQKKKMVLEDYIDFRGGEYGEW